MKTTGKAFKFWRSYNNVTLRCWGDCGLIVGLVFIVNSHRWWTARGNIWIIEPIYIKMMQIMVNNGPTRIMTWFLLLCLIWIGLPSIVDIKLLLAPDEVAWSPSDTTFSGTKGPLGLALGANLWSEINTDKFKSEMREKVCPWFSYHYQNVPRTCAKTFQTACSLVCPGIHPFHQNDEGQSFLVQCWVNRSRGLFLPWHLSTIASSEIKMKDESYLT